MTVEDKVEFILTYALCSGWGQTRLYRNGFRNTFRNRLTVALWLLESGERDQRGWDCAEVADKLERRSLKSA